MKQHKPTTNYFLDYKFLLNISLQYALMLLNYYITYPYLWTRK